jgi:hypothetical protein
VDVLEVTGYTVLGEFCTFVHVMKVNFLYILVYLFYHVNVLELNARHPDVLLMTIKTYK